MARPTTSPAPVPTAAWWQRLALLAGAPLVFLLLLELGLRLLGVGQSTAFFIPDERPGYYRTNPAFPGLFLPENFGIRPLNFRLPRHKPAGGLRVFVLGESAAQGTPEPGFGFAAQLQAQLQAQFPQRAVAVYNLGITAVNSHVIDEIARQLPEFEPDVVVVYMGNNEVIGPYGPGSVYLDSTPPRWLVRASVWARGLRTGQLLLRAARLLGRHTGPALEWRGMETFARSQVRGTDPRLAAVYANFAANLRDIVAVLSGAGARVVVSTVVANLKDSSPFVSLHREGLPAADVAAWQLAYASGRDAWRREDPVRAEPALVRALRLDPEYADTHYLLGRLALARGDVAAARRYFLDALHWDALRFRPDAEINELIRRVAAAAGPSVQLVDAARELGSDPASTCPPAGREILFEHVHLNWEGNAALAALLARACVPGGADAARWLSPGQCAEVLGYTAYSRQNMLQKMVNLTGKAPFTGQLGYREGQEFLRAELLSTRQLLGGPAGLQSAADAVAAALHRRPDPTTAVQLGFLELGLGYPERALEAVNQAIELQPPTAVLQAQKANLLLQLHRTDEAEALLRQASLEDPYYSPVWLMLAELWASSGKTAAGRAFLEARLAAQPGNNYIRTARATLLERSGEAGAAIAEWRAVLASDPSNPLALEKLTVALEQAGDQAALLDLLREGAAAQPRNYANNARLAQACADRHDHAQEASSLEALVESGPVDARLCLQLTRLLAHLGRPSEAAAYAHLARTLARGEGNPDAARTAESLERELTRD
jgi:tetratricopeptide (TPR) repeat protein